MSANVGVRKFLIVWAVMSNLLACILACLSEGQHDEGIKEMCSSGVYKLWKIKITPNMYQIHVN